MIYEREVEEPVKLIESYSKRGELLTKEGKSKIAPPHFLKVALLLPRPTRSLGSTLGVWTRKKRLVYWKLTLNRVFWREGNSDI